MSITYSQAQIRRLKELEADPADMAACFTDPAQRDQTFQDLAKGLVTRERAKLQAYRDGQRRPDLCILENRLAETLTAKGFIQVTTPIIMSNEHLARMGIDQDHPLSDQVYWLGKSKCLRPMLAPHLYYVVKDMLRLWGGPVGLFEVGPCFRKETQGAAHSSEFTMLNVAEFGTPMEQRQERLREMAAWVMNGVGITDYKIQVETSNVYGDTIDVVAGPDELEVASCALGPHFLDPAWGITDTWVGLGFGLERLVMAAGGFTSLGRIGRSLTYLNGLRLNV